MATCSGRSGSRLFVEIEHLFTAPVAKRFNKTEFESSLLGLSRASLKIDVMTEDREGRYTCFVNSIGGSQEAHAHITLRRS